MVNNWWSAGESLAIGDDMQQEWGIYQLCANFPTTNRKASIPRTDLPNVSVRNESPRSEAGWQKAGRKTRVVASPVR